MAQNTGSYYIKASVKSIDMMTEKEIKALTKRECKFAKEVKVNRNDDYIRKFAKEVKGENNLILSRSMFG